MRCRFLVAAAMAVPLAACATGQSSTQPSASSPPAPEPCTAQALSTSLGGTEGAAGTSYVTIVLTNTGDQACTLSGFPQAQPVRGTAREAVGPRSGRNALEGSGGTVTLAAEGGSARVVLGIANASNYVVDQCVPRASDGVLVTFAAGSGPEEYVSLTATQVCSRLTSTTISGVLPAD